MAKRRIKKIYYLGFKIFFSFCILVVAVLAVIYFFRAGKPVFYPGFGITIPSGYSIHGIDVSRYQGNIEWGEVKNMESMGLKIGFAFIKATEGNTRVDRQFDRNWKKAKEQGIPTGAYHFFIPGKDPHTQAANFIQTVTLAPGNLPPVLDIEKTGRLSVSQLRSDVQQWLDKVESHYGVTPIIYTNISFYEKYFSSGFEKYPIWIAHYLQPHKPRTERKWTFWQHSEVGQVNGIRHKVDFNVFYGDSSDFKKLLIGALP